MNLFRDYRPSGTVDSPLRAEVAWYTQQHADDILSHFQRSGRRRARDRPADPGGRHRWERLEGHCRPGEIGDSHSLEQRLVGATNRIQEGAKISEALEQTGDFPVIALRMIGVGESSGSLVDMLVDVSEYYENEVERRLDRLTTMIEPLMMLLMAGLISVIVVAMYLPIFQMAGTVQ